MIWIEWRSLNNASTYDSPSKLKRQVKADLENNNNWLRGLTEPKKHSEWYYKILMDVKNVFFKKTIEYIVNYLLFKLTFCEWGFNEQMYCIQKYVSLGLEVNIWATDPQISSVAALNRKAIQTCRAVNAQHTNFKCLKALHDLQWQPARFPIVKGWLIPVA